MTEEERDDLVERVYGVVLNSLEIELKYLEKEVGRPMGNMRKLIDAVSETITTGLDIYLPLKEVK